MPDHVHFVLEGTAGETPITTFVSRAKQASGFAFAQRSGYRLWQRSSWDRVLRSDEDTVTVIRYVLDNPVRAGLVKRAGDYPFSGSMEWTRDELFTAIEVSPG